MRDRIKFAYLNYHDMLSKINSGEINEYDIIFSKDKLVTYLITEDLQPLELRSRVYIFNSIEEAEITLNQSSDTYIGQVVSILYGDTGTYRGYIVNRKNNKFTVTPLWEHPEQIDYNTLGNRPITNLIGTLDKPILVTELDNGIYKIKGQYKISNLEKTIYLSASDTVVIVKRNAENISVKKITSDNITDYIINDSSIKKDSYVTAQYLTDNSYTTSDYVDEKIEALEVSIKEDVRSYIEDSIKVIFTEELDKKIDMRIAENIQPTEASQIQELF